MYKCNQNENKQFLKRQPYNNLKQVLLNNINHKRGFIELFNFLDGEDQKLLQQFMINILSNPYDYTIADLEEMFTL